MRKLFVVIAVVVLVWSNGALASDCVDVELMAEVVAGDPLDILQLFFSLENCGTEPGAATLTVSLTKDEMPIGTASAEVFLPAGKLFSKELELPLPPFIPAGTYGLCVTAELGTASDTACATIVLNDAGSVISFATEDPDPKDLELTWGAIKASYH